MRVSLSDPSRRVARARPALVRTVTPDERRADAWLAAALLIAAILSAWLGQVAGLYGTESPPFAWALVFAAALTVPLAFRRRFPELTLVLVAVAFFLGVTFRIPDAYVGNVAVFIAMYTVGAWVPDRQRATAVRLFVVVGMFVWLIITTFQAAVSPDDDGFSREGLFSPFAAFMIIQFLVNVAYFGGAWYFGDRAWAQAASRAVLEERTAELEREREITAAQAVALDRVRIARELHDVVAHHVSAMGVQAGAARAVLDRDPTAARAALGSVEESARSALTELRQLLDTLRTPDAGAPSDSTLSLAGLRELVAHAEQNGLPTSFAVIGAAHPVPDVVQVNLYRIAQEALTNARRHAGPDAAADVRLRYTGGAGDGAAAVELEVTNTGRVPAASRPGLGLVGMRERAAASGGTIDTGARPRGGFLVRVRVPLDRRQAPVAEDRRSTSSTGSAT